MAWCRIPRYRSRFNPAFITVMHAVETEQGESASRTRERRVSPTVAAAQQNVSVFFAPGASRAITIMIALSASLGAFLMPQSEARTITASLAVTAPAIDG